MNQKVRMRNCLASCLSVCLLATAVTPAGAAAATETAKVVATPVAQGDSTSPHNVQVSLEQALIKAKEAFPVPDGFTNFQSSLNGDGDQTAWSLSWRPEKKSGYFEVSVDANRGEILSMNIWQERVEPERANPFPSLSLDNARDKAWRLVKQLNPTKCDDLELQIDGLSGSMMRTEMEKRYHFVWQRTQKGIPFPANTISVEMDANTGDLLNYFVNWANRDVPSSQGVISLDQARQIYEKEGMLELQYFTPRTPDGKKAKEPQLVYRLNHPSNGRIDAFTGQPVKPEMVGFRGGMGSGGDLVMSKKEAANLTPQENKEIELTGKLLPKEKALQAVTKWFDIPQGATLLNARLSRFEDDEFAWSFDWQPANKDDKQRRLIPFTTARVNAQTGDLIEFYSYKSNETSNDAGDLPREEAQKIAEAFLQKIQPDRFSKIRINSSEQILPDVASSKHVPQHSFTYRRYVGDVPYPENFIEVSVDSKTKKVTSYQVRWNDSTSFASPDGALGPSAAVDAFLKSRPLTLTYVYGDTVTGKKTPIKLVYLAKEEQNGFFYEMIDARSGQPLQFDGKPAELPQKGFHFTDIDDNPLAKEIHQLGQLKAFREFGDALHPGEPVSAVSLLRSMVLTRSDFYREDKPTDGEIIDRARSLGWLTETIQPGDTVNRELLAKWMVRMLKLEPAARLQSIYQLPQEDAASLPDQSKGYVALAWGLGLLPGGENALAIDQPVTRLEAATALVRALKVK
ncbi:hypothetical protein GTO89_12300 [Heliobacterium gestii]|uniref:SLH domain-containing protein n=1 Tax=Heliomicrobium gestii TaxID=2699 RepID=A0A845LGV4_HELGE|nr:PepSY domain-containing protein [Heliomicrobium gestii]MBM7867264.1 putative membrane protein YkoI [Heliomicrobium gestii]MZP43819.1 hypothetical protein [Heliomicrobium gestii]